jgi:hypothetical protein
MPAAACFPRQPSGRRSGQGGLPDDGLVGGGGRLLREASLLRDGTALLAVQDGQSPARGRGVSGLVSSVLRRRRR